MQDYGLDIYLFQVWDDVRLAHDQEQERQFYLSGNDIKKIWTPDTYFMNAKQTDIKDVSFNIVTIFHLRFFLFPAKLRLSTQVSLDSQIRSCFSAVLL